MSFLIITATCCACRSDNQSESISNHRSRKASNHVTAAPRAINDKLLSTPKPGSILKETIDKDTGAVILNLSNGAKVIVKNTLNKDNSSDGIVLVALAKGGTMAVTNKDDIPSARFASEMLSVSDMDKPNNLCIDIYGFERCLGGCCGLNDIKEFFENIHFVFTNQTLDSNNFNNLLESYKKDWKEHDGGRLTQDQKILYDNNPNFNVIGANNHSHFDFLKPCLWSREYLNGELKIHYIKEPIFPYVNFFEKSDYPKISQERALEFLKKCFNPSDFTFVFVGDIDLKILKPYVKTYIASIPSSKPLINQKVTRPKPSKWEIYLDDEYQTNITMSWVIDEKYSQKLNAIAKVLEAYVGIIFNDSSKYSYGVSLNPFYNELYMGICVSSEPEIVKEDISAVFKQIQKIAEGNIDLSILSKTKNAIQQLYKDVSNDNYDLAIANSYACSAALHNTALSEFERFPCVCQAVSSKDLKDLASRLLKGKYYQIISHPKNKNIK